MSYGNGDVTGESALAPGLLQDGRKLRWVWETLEGEEPFAGQSGDADGAYDVSLPINEWVHLAFVATAARRQMKASQKREAG